MTDKKKIPWSKLVLFTSLGVNLVVVGLVAGAWFNGPKRGDRGERVSWNAGPFGRALSPADRRTIGLGLRNNPELRENLRAGRGEMREIGLAIAASLRADPFDPKALEALFARQEQMGLDLQKIGRGALLDRITAMSPEDRASFADRLEEGMKRGGKRGKDKP